MDTGLLGKVDLPPVPGAAQFPNSLARRRTDAPCHAFMIGLGFALYLTHTLSGRRKAGIMRLHSVMRPLAATLVLVFSVGAFAKDDWQSDLHKWVVSNDTNPNCRVRYTTGLYRPDMGNQPAWNMMTEKMFKWFSTDGVKLAPSVCPVSRATRDKAEYRILFSVSPMKMVSQTTRGSETQTTTEPFNANVTSQTTYSNGSSSNSTATINGEETTTVVVPTETTISRSSVAVYMYTYRVSGNQLELIGSDSVVFSRVAASGSGENAAGAELGAGIGNLIRASRDRHRADKLYEEALKAISADVPVSAAKQNILPENHASEKAPTDTQGTPVTVAPIPPTTSPAPANVAALPSAQSIGTPKEQAATDDAEIQFHIGTLYETGKGVPQDYTQAATWYRKAAEQGLYSAELNLGVLYATGQGVPQDYGEAYFWFDLAAAGPQTPAATKIAAENRDGAASHLTPADLSHVQERARKWFEDHPAKPQ